MLATGHTIVNRRSLPSCHHGTYRLNKKGKLPTKIITSICKVIPVIIINKKLLGQKKTIQSFGCVFWTICDTRNGLTQEENVNKENYFRTCPTLQKEQSQG